MSRIGKLPVPVPSGVEVAFEGQEFKAKGPKGTITKAMPPLVDISIEDGAVVVRRQNDGGKARAMHGLARSLIRNVVEGVNTGFAKTLEINGVGYRVQPKKEYLIFSLGYSHPIYYELPEGVTANIESPTKITVSGIDKESVGKAAAKIRSFRPPEPYKGKGIKYDDEVIRRKEGKSGAR